jgi:flavin-dependent dehydrogenase
MIRVDAVVIGGSLAGATCVRELTRLGIDAVAIERESFPREKVCGGFVSPGAVDILDELGVLAAVRRAGAVDVRSARIRMRDVDVSLTLPRPGLGISRKALDAVVAGASRIHQAAAREVVPHQHGFHIRLDDDEVEARVVVDAAGKLSRFTERISAEQFGVQFYVPHSRGDVLDFWFYSTGYGGAVTVEGDRSNICFLINKDALPEYSSRPGCRVTGPVAYDRKPSGWIAIGDAAGMVDPFCGEGIRHALDTGRLAAAAVAEGIRNGWTYEKMRLHYDLERSRRWQRKRRLVQVVRGLLKYPRLAGAGLRLRPDWLLRQFWK